MAAPGEYVVYVDEAGDHGPVSKEFPVFVLAFCVFRKDEYVGWIVPAVHALKFQYLGHDAVVLHEREIRKQLPPFDFLRDAATRAPFFEDLNLLVTAAPFVLIAVVVDKRRNAPAHHAYRDALEAGLVAVSRYLQAYGERGTTHVVLESRGKNEDRDLQASFEALSGPAGNLSGCNLELIFAPKAHGLAGMEFADLTARPVGRHMMDPGQTNRAYDILKDKLCLFTLPSADPAEPAPQG